jgi:hypothetical protein
MTVSLCRPPLLALLAAALLSGCAGKSGPPARVRRQAAADLQCPPEQLTYLRRENDVYRAYGCGQEVTYVRACPRGGCNWMRDGVPRPSAGPPPPKPPPPPVDLPPVVSEPPPPSAPLE